MLFLLLCVLFCSETNTGQYDKTHCVLQAVIDANIFPVLIEILNRAEFKTRKEAAWAITNATSGGSPEQIR